MNRDPTNEPVPPAASPQGVDARLNAIRLSCDTLNALREELSAGGEVAASREHLLTLGAEIRKLAETMRNPGKTN